MSAGGQQGPGLVGPRQIRLLMHLRRAGVTDHRVLGAIERVPREAFVPDAFLDQAYEDIALPIGRGQTISQPLIVGLMTQALAVTDLHKVLEIGTGSGYQACILSKVCRRVYTIERHKALLDEATGRFDALKVRNVTSRHGDGMRGWPEQAPFERIIVTAAHRGMDPPPGLTEQLAPGGLLVIPMGDEKRSQRVVRFTATPNGLKREDLWPVRFVPLLPDLPDAGDRGTH